MNSRKIQAVLVAALAMVLIALVFVFAGMLRSRVYSRGPVPAEKSARQEKVIKVKTVQKTAPAPRAPWRAANEGLKVTLNAKGAVWVMVKSGEKTVYVATMSKGESKTIETDGDLKLWTGKAENLELVVNGRDIGNVARGVVKNIRISSDSVMIGDSLVTRLQ